MLKSAATSGAPRSPRNFKGPPSPELDDEALLDAVQRQTFRYFWEGAHPTSGLAYDRKTEASDDEDLIGIGGSGFGALCILVAASRGWISREDAIARLQKMVGLLLRATCFHGMFPHFMNGRSGATIPFSRKDDGGDLVETAYLLMGLLCARSFFDGAAPEERQLRERITILWEEADWSWYTQGGRKMLYWHWSPTNGWALDHEIHGWNECLIAYILAASAPRYPIDADVYHRGFAAGRDFLNGKTYHGMDLPLGPPLGGPLFFAHYSFCGLDPRGLKDRYADYWTQNRHHVLINRAHCLANPGRFRDYGDDCWGLTASDDPAGYAAHAPDHDNGTISPTAALSSLPYAPSETLRALRGFLTAYEGRLWGRYGFIDAFCPAKSWFANSFLAIDQGPIVVMIENHRSGLLWNLFMKIPEIQNGLRKLGFESPHLGRTD